MTTYHKLLSCLTLEHAINLYTCQSNARHRYSTQIQYADAAMTWVVPRPVSSVNMRSVPRRPSKARNTCMRLKCNDDNDFLK